MNEQRERTYVIEMTVSMQSEEGEAAEARIADECRSWFESLDATVHAVRVREVQA
jgi:hypothetical protein